MASKYGVDFLTKMDFSFDAAYGRNGRKSTAIVDDTDVDVNCRRRVDVEVNVKMKSF